MAELEVAIAELQAGASAQEDRLSLVVFSGELDRQLAAFVIATGAAAAGMEVSVFFTFWGTSVLRKPSRHVRKELFAKMFGWMLPAGPRKLSLSKLNLAGCGPRLMRYAMKKKGVASLEELIDIAADLGVRFSVCEMSMGLLGLERDELIDYPGLGFCGVATFIEQAAKSKVAMFL